MTAKKVNVAFMLHRKDCELCASDGRALCPEGEGLLKLFYQAIVGSTLEELRAERARA
jgi:hypothetical protein